MGPYAQDWYSLFPSGKPNLVIETMDLDGVALSAIKGLNTKIKLQEKEIIDLKEKIAILLEKIK